MHMFPGFLTSVLTQTSFQSHQLLFSHASAEVRDENMWERNFGSTRSQTHNHQVMSLTGHNWTDASITRKTVSIVFMIESSQWLNPSPQDKLLNSFKLRAFADDKINVTKKEILFGMVRKHCGKRRKCWLAAFSPFPTMFSEAFFSRVV